jgi:formiminotetrahydrofolate cyclodeaminase
MSKLPFAEYRLQEFIEALAAKRPTPGGGTASVAAALLGSALGIMVARFSEQVPQEVTVALEDINGSLLPLLDQDAAAYDRVVEAYRLPKQTQDQKERRTKAVQEALRSACDPPFEGLKLALKTIQQLDAFCPHISLGLASDFATACELLQAAAFGFKYNVEINLTKIKDTGIRQTLQDQTSKMLEEVAQVRQRCIKALQERR